jgi:hypothetical protein
LAINVKLLFPYNLYQGETPHTKKIAPSILPQYTTYIGGIMMLYPSSLAADVILNAFNQAPQSGLEAGINFAILSIAAATLFILVTGLILMVADTPSKTQ